MINDNKHPAGENYKEDDIIRKNDLVYINEPIFFERCGYPMQLKDAYEIVKEKYRSNVCRFLWDIDKENETSVSNFNNSADEERILNVLARRYMNIKGFGGRERSIYTEEKPNLIKDTRVFRVSKVSHCKTGTYVPASGGYDYYSGGYDYDYPYLDNIKTHKILDICTLTDGWIDYKATRIEAKYVRKIHVDKRWWVCNDCGGNLFYSYDTMTVEDLENWTSPCVWEEGNEGCRYEMELLVMEQRLNEKTKKRQQKCRV